MLLLMLACDDPQITPAVEPAVEPPVAASAALEVVPEPAEETPPDPRLTEMFSEEQRAAISTQRAAFEAISTADEFAASFRASKAMASNLSESLQRRYEAAQDSDEFANMDLTWLKPLLPGMEEAYFAEGTALQLVLMPEPWAARAAATPQPDDDAFLAFMALSYDNAGAVGWPTWNVRNWDYGGCSGLGSGSYAATFAAADAALALGELFKPEITEIRTRLMADLLTTASSFEWCDPETMNPTPPEALIKEATTILKTATLTDAEKAQIQARIDAKFALEVYGG